MKDKENIEELFREGLKDFQSNVDPSVWQGVQSGLTAASASSAAAAGSVLGKMSIAAKAIIGVSAAAILSTTAYLIFADQEVEKIVSKEKVEELNIEKTSPEETQIIDLQDEEKDEQNEIVIQDSNQQEYIEPISTNSIQPNEVENGNKEKTIEPVITELQHKEEINNTQNSIIDKTSQQEEDESKKLKSFEIEIIKQENQYVELKVVGDMIDPIEWDMGDGYTVEGEFIQYYYDEPGNYTVRLTSGKVDKRIELEVFIEGKIGDLPNVFTPNNDGVNDHLFIETEGLKDFTIVVFDENQKVVFTDNNPNFKWDGIHQRTLNKCEVGNYYYIITASDAKGNTINKHQVLSIEY